MRWFRPPAVRPVSTVGAGDSMVAGIAAALAEGQDLDDAVRLARGRGNRRRAHTRIGTLQS